MSKLKVAATRDGWRRAGRAWTKEPQTVDASDFTSEQIEQLKADPNIIVMPARAAPAAPEIPPAVRERFVRLAVLHLSAESEGKKPVVKDVQQITGLKDVTAAERDEHFAAVEAARSGPGADAE